MTVTEGGQGKATREDRSMEQSGGRKKQLMMERL